MFQLPEPTTMKLKKAGTHVENHGNEERIALDMRVIWVTNNRNLDKLKPGLRKAFYCNLQLERESANQEGQLDLQDDVELPNVRFPDLDYPIKITNYQQVGARVKVGYGIDDVSAVLMQLAKADKFEFTPIEGGSAKIEYSITSSADINRDMIGTISMLQKHDISVTQTMPDVDVEKKPLTPEDIFAGTAASEPKRPLTPEDVFVNQSQPADSAPPAAVAKRSSKDKKA